jgi:hypothetical protein
MYRGMYGIHVKYFSISVGEPSDNGEFWLKHLKVYL